MPGQVVTDTPDVLHRRVGIKDMVQVGAQKVSTDDHAIGSAGRLRHFLCLSRLTERVVRNELRPNRLDDV